MTTSPKNSPSKKTSKNPKEKVFQVAHALNTTLARLPIAAGDVVIPDVCGTGVSVVATKSAK